MTAPSSQRLTAKRAAMPHALADVHFHLEDELLSLNVLWSEYVELFDTNERRIDLMNSTAPTFFVAFNDIVWHDVLLRLCALTDPPKSVGKDNLTVRRLPDAITDASLKARVESEVANAAQATEFARDWRNRGLAHFDLGLWLNPKVRPLATVDHSSVGAALEALALPMNSISAHYLKTQVDFAGTIRPFGGSRGLVYYLSSGLEADEARKNDGASWSPPHW